MEWSRFEACLQGLLWTFLKLSMSDGRIITTKMDAGFLIQSLRALGNRHLPQGWRLQTFLDEMNLADGYREDRNLMMHGLWSMLQPENIPTVMSLRTKSAPGEIVSETVSDHRMHQLIRNMKISRAWLLKLEREIATSRDTLLIQHPPD